MQDSKESVTEKLNKYRNDVEELSRYLGWLESKKGQDMSRAIDPTEGKGNTIKVPVYDSTLLGFIKKAQKTAFVTKNYVYIYRRYHLQTAEDEHRLIDKTQIMEIENLGAILSSYVLRGMTKGTVWNEGVRNGVLWHTVSKMKELVDFWTA
ncbi:MAG: hypothetical protein K6B69_02270 [Lachnospiraceae bacterium]|nr:hypothetical protein [Lachnospiraceae bacterium]MCR5126908.1 hypothetical protein [Lachnospiraceae bacterium]